MYVMFPKFNECASNIVLQVVTSGLVPSQNCDNASSQKTSTATISQYVIKCE